MTYSIAYFCFSPIIEVLFGVRGGRAYVKTNVYRILSDLLRKAF